MKKINAEMYKNMLEKAYFNLSANANYIDSLNVFPVPDGDTGANMFATMKNGWETIKDSNETNIGSLANEFAMGLLMGARGNSGVILSQIFRGIAKEIQGKDEITLLDFSKALKNGSDTAYAAILKPTEGTILTVIRETAEVAPFLVDAETLAADYFDKLLLEMEKSLNNTPELLPVLKEVGVVDSGGMGLYKIFQGFLYSYTGQEIVAVEAVDLDLEGTFSNFDTEDIAHQFCTEFILKLNDGFVFDDRKVRLYLETMGDSVVVVEDSGVLKVHIHTDFPDEVFAMAETKGTIINKKVEDMKSQHSHILESENGELANQLTDRVAIIAVSSGEGLTTIFKEKGASKIISGGQTMNPSTKDFVDAINSLDAKKIVILPNNSNIILAASQVIDLLPEREIHVLPTKSMNQAISVLNVFDPESDFDSMIEFMEEIIEEVKYGEVTYAVKTTTINGVDVKENDFMAIASKNIVATGPDLLKTIKGLIDTIITDDVEIVSAIFGKNFDVHMQAEIEDFIENNFDVEIEYVNGEQDIYSFLIGVE